MQIRSIIFSILIVVGLCFTVHAQENNSFDNEQFKKLDKLKWEEVFYDSCTDDWKNHWTLDGKKAKIGNSENGMDFISGPVRRENASHSVLWTKKSFKGDIRIDYEYTKIDDILEAVTIIYIQATGSGAKGYDKDISTWADKREIPAMNVYFNHMNTYHISYAAFDIGNIEKGKDYIRARRYMPEKREGLKGTDLKPDYFETELFKKDVPHKITIIKKGNDLFMHIRNSEKKMLCHWKNNALPPVIEGRIGLRHMWTRAARYKDIRISQLED